MAPRRSQTSPQAHAGAAPDVGPWRHQATVYQSQRLPAFDGFSRRSRRGLYDELFSAHHHWPVLQTSYFSLAAGTMGAGSEAKGRALVSFPTDKSLCPICEGYYIPLAGSWHPTCWRKYGVFISRGNKRCITRPICQLPCCVAVAGYILPRPEDPPHIVMGPKMLHPARPRCWCLGCFATDGAKYGML